MATKQNNLSIKTIGLSVSAVLAVVYALVMFASLLLVGLGTTRSWQATLLRIGWSTVAGFEIGLLGIVIVGFAVAVAFVPAYNFTRRRVPSRSKTLERLSQSDRPSAGTWAFRLLAALLVLMPLTLLALRVLASAMSIAGTTGTDGANTQGPGVPRQAMNMGTVINSAHREAEPSFTADGKTMYFNCNNADICVSYLTSTWEEGKWTAPELLGAPINTAYEEIEPIISAEGDKLYFTSIRPRGRLKDLSFLSPFVNVLRVTYRMGAAGLGSSFLGGLGMADVYVSYRVGGVWSEPRNLNEATGEPPVNTSFHDHCLFFSVDGNEAFWTSTRPGGSGKDDIWTSRRVGGKWTEPENLGPNVNGPGKEHTSIPTPDGRSLYVTATRPEGFGDEDIYVTTRDASGKWGPLVNLGPLVNGPGDDRCPAWTPDLRFFLFDSVREGGFGARDIWWVDFREVAGYPLIAQTAAAPANGRLLDVYGKTR